MAPSPFWPKTGDRLRQKSSIVMLKPWLKQNRLTWFFVGFSIARTVAIGVGIATAIANTGVPHFASTKVTSTNVLPTHVFYILHGLSDPKSASTASNFYLSQDGKYSS